MYYGSKKFYLNESQDQRSSRKSSCMQKLHSYSQRRKLWNTYFQPQEKPAISPDTMALTNKRIIFYTTEIIRAFYEFWGLLMEDIADCHMSENLGATFTVKKLKIGWRHNLDCRRIL
jgi:hypothetical protein